MDTTEFRERIAKLKSEVEAEIIELLEKRNVDQVEITYTVSDPYGEPSCSSVYSVALEDECELKIYIDEYEEPIGADQLYVEELVGILGEVVNELEGGR